MSVRNRRRGFSYESRRLREVVKRGGYGFRAYASKGVVDLVYVDGKGIAHLEQCKFSSKNEARISSNELADLIRFARRFNGCTCVVSLVVKNAWKPVSEYRLNVPGIESVQTFGDLKRFYQKE